MNLHNITSLPVCLVFLFASAIILFSNIQSPINRALAWLSFLFFYWKFTDFMCLQSATYEQAYFWMKAGSLRYFSFTALFYFILYYTETNTLTKYKILYSIFYTPPVLLTLVDLATKDLVTTNPIQKKWGYIYDYVPAGPIFKSIFYIWTFLFFFYAACLLVRHSMKSKETHDRRRNQLVALAFIVPLTALLVEQSLIRQVEIQQLMLNFTLIWIIVFLSYATLRYRMFVISPETAAAEIVATMKEALLLVNSEGVILYSNRSFQDFTQMLETDLIGKNVSTLVSKGYIDHKLMESIIKGDEIDNQLISFISENGRPLFGKLSTSILSDNAKQRAGVICIISNITDLKQIQEDLRKNHDFLNITLASIKDGIIVVDPNEYITYMNPVSETLTGWKFKDTCGVKISDIFQVIDSSVDQVSTLSLNQTISKSTASRPSITCSLVNRTGQKILIEYSISPIIDSGDSSIGIVIVIRDITERRITEQKIHDAESQILNSEKLVGLGQLAAGVAHEINNPMGYMISNLNVLKKYTNHILTISSLLDELIFLGPGDNPDRLEIVRRYKEIKQKANYEQIQKDLLPLIEETLEGSERIKTIALELRDFCHPVQDEIKEIDLNSEIEKSLSLVMSELKYHCEVQKELNEIPAVICNRGQISQVFVNLLLNAARAVKEPNGIIGIKTYLENSFIYLVFSNNGEHIPPEKLSQIFNPIISTQNPSQATGLGLSLVYGIITGHNWSIDVQSKMGEGTSFTIKIPQDAYCNN